MHTQPPSIRILHHPRLIPQHNARGGLKRNNSQTSLIAKVEIKLRPLLPHGRYRLAFSAAGGLRRRPHDEM